MGEQGRVVKRPGNTPIKELMSDRRFTGEVLDFLRNTKVGKLKEGVVVTSGSPLGKPYLPST